MKHLLTLLFTVIFYFSAYSQNVVRLDTVVGKRKLDTNMVVYDEAGNALRYYQYSRLIDGGDYTISIRTTAAGSDGKPTLKKIDPKMRMMMYQMLKKQMAIKNSSLQPDKELDVTPLLEVINKDELDKKAIVLIFWNPDCPPCTESFATINAYFKQIHNPDNVVILAITAGDELRAAARLKQKPLLYARLIGGAGSIFNAYNVSTFPSYVVADKDHIIRFAVSGTGPVTMSAFKDTISEILIQ